MTEVSSYIPDQQVKARPQSSLRLRRTRAYSGKTELPAGVDIADAAQQQDLAVAAQDYVRVHDAHMPVSHGVSVRGGGTEPGPQAAFSNASAAIGYQDATGSIGLGAFLQVRSCGSLQNALVETPLQQP
jgi:hypothetical protein